MKTGCIPKGLISALLIVGIAGAGTWRSTPVLATTSQEWAAVQAVVGNDINPQAFLYPVMNAIGTQALQDGAILGIPADQFSLLSRASSADDGRDPRDDPAL